MVLPFSLRTWDLPFRRNGPHCPCRMCFFVGTLLFLPWPFAQTLFPLTRGFLEVTPLLFSVSRSSTLFLYYSLMRGSPCDYNSLCSMLSAHPPYFFNSCALSPCPRRSLGIQKIVFMFKRSFLSSFYGPRLYLYIFPVF